MATADFGRRPMTAHFKLGRYFWKLFLINAIIMALILAACVCVILGQFDRFYEKELSRHLAARAAALEIAARHRFDEAHAAELASLADAVGSTEMEGVRVTFVLVDGKVVGDSEAAPATMESHADRPEIRQALAHGTGESTRWSHTVAKNLKYVAVRVGPADDPRGVVRVAMPLRSIAARAAHTQRLMITVASASVVAAILLALALALLWSRRITRITETARSLSRGDLSARVVVSGRDEVALLGHALNEMRERISKHVTTIERQRRTLNSLVSQLREGVVVADSNGRIAVINLEARRMLGIPPATADDALVGRTVEQCIPQSRLQEMLLSADRAGRRGGQEPAREARNHPGEPPDPDDQQTTLTIPTSKGTRSILARAFDIRFPPGRGEAAGGAPQAARMLILTDVTELTRVMQIKAHLAANASHELRTPLSAMRAALDTLQSLDLVKDTEAALQFIDVLDRHNLRMEAMIGDLLELSRLESGTSRFQTATLSAREIVEELHVQFADALSTKQLHWRVAIPPPDVTFKASPELVRMILRNLVDNAIRFNGAGGRVHVTVSSDDKATTIEVADTGCGIAPEDHERVFERFYQVERARSGPDRGTGLGLSIVRHAVAAMNGQINLQSELGQGTRVTITIP
ncbi:MAG: ATP-binding protein [Phycisphaerae bacterium]